MTEEEFWAEKSDREKFLDGPSVSYDERQKKREVPPRGGGTYEGLFQDLLAHLIENYPLAEKLSGGVLTAYPGEAFGDPTVENRNKHIYGIMKDLGDRLHGGVTSAASTAGRELGKVGDAARREYVTSMVNNYHPEAAARARAEMAKDEKMGPPAPKKDPYGGIKNSPLDPNQGLINRETGEILRFEDMAQEMAANQPKPKSSELSRGLGLDLDVGRLLDGVSEGGMQYLALASTPATGGQVPASMLNTKRRDQAAVEAARVKASAAEAAAKARINARSFVNASIALQTPEDQELLMSTMGALINQFEAEFNAGKYGAFGQNIGGNAARSAAARQLAEANRWVQLLQTNESMRKTTNPTQAQKHLEGILSGQRPITTAESIGVEAYGAAGTAADEQGFK